MPTTQTRTHRIAPDTGIGSIMDALLGGPGAEAQVEQAIAASEYRVDAAAFVARLTDGALELTGDAFPPDYDGVDDMSLAATYEVV